MLRIRLDKLSSKKGLAYFQGSPFTGIAYRVEGSLVLENLCIDGGIVRSVAELCEPGVSRVLRESLVEVDFDETDEQHPNPGFYFDGMPFRGVAYEFDPDTGRLESEYAYTEMGPGAGREWYPSGKISIENDRTGKDGEYESEAWHENGQRRLLSTRNLSAAYTKQGLLIALSLYPGYSESALSDQSLSVGQELLLSGDGIDDEIIRRLEGLEHLTELGLSNTKITEKGLQRFGVSRSLRQIDTEGNSQFNREDIQQLLSNIPNCEWIDRDTLLKNREEL